MRIESAVAELVGLALKMSKFTENSKFYDILKISKKPLLKRPPGGKKFKFLKNWQIVISDCRIESAVAELVGLTLKMSKLVENSKFNEILKMSKIGKFCIFPFLSWFFCFPRLFGAKMS